MPHCAYLQPSHLRPALLCCSGNVHWPQDQESHMPYMVRGRQVSGSAHPHSHPPGPVYLCVHCQGQLYCVAQVRYRLCSPRSAAAGEGQVQFSCSHDPVGATLPPAAYGKVRRKGIGSLHPLPCRSHHRVDKGQGKLSHTHALSAGSPAIPTLSSSTALFR